MRFGYARTSTPDQDLQLQLDALQAAGCDEVITEQASGSALVRPERARLLDKVRAGDEVVVWRLDRLGRSAKDLIEVVERMEAHQVNLISLQESIDTTTASGKLVFHIFSAFAEFERALIQERTRHGLAAAAAKGRRGGRPKAMTPEKLEAARALIAKRHTVAAAAKAIGVSESTLYRALRAQGGDSTSR